MQLVLCWLVFPLVVALAALGLGLLVELAAGRRVPGTLLLPLGLAAIVVVTQLLVWHDLTAGLATPCVVLLALAGLVAGRRRVTAGARDWWAAAAALGTFVLLGLPVVLSGQATFLGYGLLGDTSIHFVLIDRLMHHGPEVTGLAPSSYRSALNAYFATSYPTGAQSGLGVLRPLVGTDVAWLFQPYLSLIVAMLALSLYELLRPVAGSRPARALMALLAAQPGLVYAYALQGSIKELATTWLVALLVAVVPVTLAPGGVRRLAPILIASAAAIGVISLSSLPWLGPVLLAVAIALLLQRGRTAWRPTVVEAAAFAGALALLVVPSLAGASAFVRVTTKVVTSSTELGNLLRPLSAWQAFGIWPRGDYRLTLASHAAITYVLIGAAAVACVLGLGWMARRRAGAPLLFVAVSLVGWLYVSGRGSPWADAKALMIVSPAFAFAAAAGVAGLYGARRRLEAVALGGALAFGVLWTNALAYHDVDLAPRDRLVELAQVGDRIAGRGPTLAPEFEEFGKHFLRTGTPTAPADHWKPADVPATGVPFGLPVDLDRLGARYVSGFRTLVLRRSPLTSRPPTGFALAWRGRWYEIWVRRGPRPLAHVPLGRGLDPGSVPRCRAVRSLAALASAAHGRLAAAPRPRAPIVLPAGAARPPTWPPDPTEPFVVHPHGPGQLNAKLAVPRPGRYQLWLGGSFGRGFTARIDGRRVGSVSYALNERDQYELVGEVTLVRGRHALRLDRSGGDLHPGNGGESRILGPIVLAGGDDVIRPVVTLAPARWRSLCGRQLDWVEAVV